MNTNYLKQMAQATTLSSLRVGRPLALVMFSGLAACTSITPNFDANFGKSVTALKLAQTKNPVASLANKDKSIDGIEGRVARESIQRYHQSFIEPPPPTNVFNIGVGSGSN